LITNLHANKKKSHVKVKVKQTFEKFIQKFVYTRKDKNYTGNQKEYSIYTEIHKFKFPSAVNKERQAEGKVIIFNALKLHISGT
jgi:hypothetical protein